MASLNSALLSTLINSFNGTSVNIKYDLISSTDVVIQSLYIGYTEIDLKKDQDAEDKNHFLSTADGYEAIYREQGLRISIFALGMAGGFLELKVSVKGPSDNDYKNLKTYPIKSYTDNKGHLDTNKFYKY